MWLQAISLVTAFTAVHGMCFGVPLQQPPVGLTCPDHMVYYSQLCICLEPKHLDRFNEIGTLGLREVPMASTNFMDPTETFKSKLDALRHRLTASLPDVSHHGYGSAIGDVRIPLTIFADRYLVPSNALDSILSSNYNGIPRSWRIGGLLESWSNEALARGEIPTVNTGGPFNPATSGWGPGVNDLSTLSLLERLHNMRTMWRYASQPAEDNRLTEARVANEFFKHLPITGISPDTARSYYSAAGVPDAPQPQKMLTQSQLSQTTINQKHDELLTSGLGILPKESIRGRPGSHLRRMTKSQSTSTSA
ncbi:hypothetical protein BgiMline_000759 [Biomphalaria glabrata]|uniref:Uncharacterized protein LOC106072021 n=1 Tax=Biomphalaria glabrata TaxID=6526 RepID=A0A9U8EHF0_BIOGL|nr:uncharacterized protein LOC106072021 [Biomphalaria glabrata]XP_013087732.2 uncharacterized protein LOC106072021 [Biomphalaria glabrata]XP_013087738.2 uncharacterized protein LOC106072021 [Biomphalaria glabrata]KAI8768685.1 hypothetical protein BgiMline_000708 [Biomphalaria glabrata]KAI8777887.1 hypothetical protein BgiBS90_022090 [Biomphalaria glabrata]